MTKLQLATLTREAQMLAQIRDNSETKLIEVIESTFSALSTSNPDLALNVLDQLAEQRQMLSDAAEERERDDEAYIQRLRKALPDQLDLDDPEDSEGEIQ